MKKNLVLFALSILSYVACTNKSSINQEEAGTVITTFLKGNPEYKTAHFNYGKIKFNSKNELKELVNYKMLANQGYINLSLIEAKKKILSKDSSFVYQIALTQKASDLVFKQNKNEATVKVADYVLASEKSVNFWTVNSTTAKVTVTLKKVNTVFAPFQKEDENSEFMTKTYRLKLNKEEGWKVVK